MRAKLFVATLSIVNLSFQPLAMAKGQDQWSTKALKDFVKSTQETKGKTKTLEKFWQANRKDLNVEIQKMLKPSLELQKNQNLPKMEVIGIKGPQGRESARMIINMGGRTISVEFLGSKEKFVRVNGIVLSEAEASSFPHMMAKLSQDPVIAGEISRTEDQVMKRSVTPSYAEYKRMSAEQRAMMLIKLRQSSEAASEVLNLAQESQKGKKTSFLSLAFFNEAIAQTQADIRAARGKPCLVAGYVGKIVTSGSRTYCDPAEGIKRFEELTGIKSSCTGGSHGCNPMSFPKSGSICEKPSRSDNYQEFTRRCGEASPIKTPEQQAELVKAYLKKKDSKDLSFALKDGKVDNEEEYNKFIKPYMDEHNRLNEEAYQNVCATSNFSIVSKIDRKLQSACETLKDRKLSLELFKAETGGSLPPVTAPNPPPGSTTGGEGCHTESFKGEKTKDNFDGKKDKDGKCVAIAVPVPAPAEAGAVAAETPESCQAKNMDFAVDPNGKAVCVERDRAIAAAGIGGVAARKEPSFWDRNKSWIMPVAIFGGLFLLFKKFMFNPGSTGGAIAGTPPAPPPLPPAPPPVSPPPVVPPIEGGSGTGGAPAGGQR